MFVDAAFDGDWKGDVGNNNMVRDCIEFFRR